MSYFKNDKYWGGGGGIMDSLLALLFLAPIMTKFDILIEFDKFTPKITQEKIVLQNIRVNYFFTNLAKICLRERI